MSDKEKEEEEKDEEKEKDLSSTSDHSQWPDEYVPKRSKGTEGART